MDEFFISLLDVMSDRPRVEPISKTGPDRVETLRRVAFDGIRSLRAVAISGRRMTVGSARVQGVSSRVTGGKPATLLHTAS
jgi:hypothetical protein